MAEQDADDVTITGGAISGVTLPATDITGTLGVPNGGTGADTLTGYVKGNGTAAMTASATVPSTDITGLGTMSTQNTNSVSITGGSISGTTVAGYVPTTTTITAGTGLSGGGDLSANRTLSISNTTVTAAAYGSASKTLTATVNAQGQLTALADTNIAITNTQVSGLGTASTRDAGVALGVATLDAAGKVPVTELPDAVLGALSYQGTWDASTNTPTLTSSVGTKGYYYVVSVAGSTNLNGITDWLVGDWAVYNGTVWQKVDNTDAGGDVVGPASATDNAVARFDTTTGKLIQNSLVIIGDTGSVTGVNALTAESLTVNNNATFGTSNSDTINFVGRINSDFDPATDNTYDLGRVGHEWRDLYIDGTANIDSLIADTADINAGTIDNTTIGATTPQNGSFVNLSVTGTTSFDGSQGTSGQVLTSAGTGNTPTWTTPTTGTVTSVTGTAPVVSSGGNTPAISMAAATGSVDGYLTSTDWTTFNNKGSGSVTSVGISAPSIFTVSNSPVTGSGTLDLTYSGTALPIANGGTGQTTANTAFNALAPSQTSNTGKYLTTDGTDTSWATVSAASDLLENNQIISTNYTVTASKNALAVGPITINTGASVTVGTGQRWLILN
jgi:hypothetical protein